MQKYELTYIMSPDMTSEEAQNRAKEIEDAIQKNEGTIIKQSPPIARTLSYQIKKHASGFFGVIEFQMEQEKLQEIQTMVRKDAKITRHMLLAKPPVRIKKQRRSKKEAVESGVLPSIEAKPSLLEKLGFGKKEETPEPAVEKVAEKVEKAKVELKDIEEQLDEILGE